MHLNTVRYSGYMHDGRFSTLDQVIDHYERGILERPTLSPDLSRPAFQAKERDQLLAFLATLTSETQEPLPVVVAPIPSAPEPVATTEIRQRDRQFAPGHVRIDTGQHLTVLNDDTRLHNVRSTAPAFDSGVQAPGQTVEVPFAAPGHYQLFCGIHPTMRLTVEVEAASGTE